MGGLIATFRLPGTSGPALPHHDLFSIPWSNIWKSHDSTGDKRVVLDIGRSVWRWYSSFPATSLCRLPPPLTDVLNLYIMWFSAASFLPAIPHKNLGIDAGQDLKITSWVGQLIIVKTLGTKSI